MQIGPEGFFVQNIPRSQGQTWAPKLQEFWISYFTMPAIRQPLIKKEERERQKDAFAFERRPRSNEMAVVSHWAWASLIRRSLLKKKWKTWSSSGSVLDRETKHPLLPGKVMMMNGESFLRQKVKYGYKNSKFWDKRSNFLIKSQN